MTARADVHKPGDAGRELRLTPKQPGEPRPNLTGDLDSMLGTGPAFRSAVRGYDRLQVDNYVTWVEAELQTARRQVEELTGRYGSCLAELEISRRLLAQSPTGRELSRISERIGTMLRLAADEAADLTTAGTREAERILGEARTEADAMLRKAHEVKQSALAAGDRMRHDARGMRAEAMRVLDRARREAAELLQAAAVERGRLDAQTEEARECLRQVTAQIGDAIEAIAGDLRREFGRPGQPLPQPHRFQGNTVQRLGAAAPAVPAQGGAAQESAAAESAVTPEHTGS